MKAKLLVAALCCILSAPFLANEFKNSAAKISTAQFAALAGHTTSGQFCTCPSPGCIPDIGEICGDGVTRAPGEDSPVDFGAVVLLVAVAGFAFLRLRAVV